VFLGLGELFSTGFEIFNEGILGALIVLGEILAE